MFRTLGEVAFHLAFAASVALYTCTPNSPTFYHPHVDIFEQFHPTEIYDESSQDISISTMIKTPEAAEIRTLAGRKRKFGSSSEQKVTDEMERPPLRRKISGKSYNTSLRSSIPRLELLLHESKVAMIAQSYHMRKRLNLIKPAPKLNTDDGPIPAGGNFALTFSMPSPPNNNAEQGGELPDEGMADSEDDSGYVSDLDGPPEDLEDREPECANDYGNFLALDKEAYDASDAGQKREQQIRILMRLSGEGHADATRDVQTAMGLQEVEEAAFVQAKRQDTLRARAILLPETAWATVSEDIVPGFAALSAASKKKAAAWIDRFGLLSTSSRLSRTDKKTGRRYEAMDSLKAEVGSLPTPADAVVLVARYIVLGGLKGFESQLGVDELVSELEGRLQPHSQRSVDESALVKELEGTSLSGTRLENFQGTKMPRKAT